MVVEKKLLIEIPHKRDNKPLVVAVLVLYFPDREVSARISAIAKQVDAVVFVDNSGTGNFFLLPAELSALSIHCIQNSENLGVATALNQGLAWAQQAGATFALLLDQDTEPLPDMVASLMRIHDHYVENSGKVIVGSNYINGLGKVQFPCPDRVEWISRKTVITAGTLLSVDVFRTLGPFREEFFIDAVDTEYCLRAVQNGIGVIMTCAPLIRHAIGYQKRHRLLWKKTAVSNHSALRRYYMAKNNMRLKCEYWRSEPRWSARKTLYLAKTLALILLFEVDKSSKIAAFGRGVLHGALGKGRHHEGR